MINKRGFGGFSPDFSSISNDFLVLVKVVNAKRIRTVRRGKDRSDDSLLVVVVVLLTADVYFAWGAPLPVICRGSPSG